MRPALILLLAAASAGTAACFDESVQSSFADAAVDGGSDADAWTPGGDGACPILTSTLDVFVKDAVNMAPICDATVTASAGAASVTLQVQGTPAACSYTAGFPPPPPGTYTVVVAAPGYEPATQGNVVITTDACGDTDAPTLTIAVTAQPADAATDHGTSDGSAGGG